MHIQHKQNGSGGKFFISEDNSEIAEMTYQNKSDKVIVIDHTYVDESKRDQGYGGKMVAAAVEYARSNQLKIVPQCPFAKEEFEKNDSYNDVLA